MSFQIRLAARVFIIAVFCSLISSSASADAKSTRKALEQQHTRYWKWTEDQEYKRVMTVITPDFSFRDSNGRALTRQMIERAARMPKTRLSGTRKSSTKIERLSIKGKQATIISSQHFESNYKLPPRNEAHKMVSDSTQREQWILSSGTWKMKSGETLKHILFLDGLKVGSKSTL